MPDIDRICSVRDLSVSRSGKIILPKISFSFDRGSPFAVVGESGSGKTTLLMTITGLLEPSGGEVFYESRELSSIPLSERASLFGLVFQDYQLFPHLTALENLLLAPKVRALKIGAEEATSLLESLGVGSLKDRYPANMSGGQKQRVAIARSLLLKPKILYLDEPSAALDEKTSFQLADLLTQLNEKIQVVVVSHDRPFLSRFVSRGIQMDRGKISAQGSLNEILAEQE